MKYCIEKIVYKETVSFNIMNTVTNKVHSNWKSYSDCIVCARDLNRSLGAA